MYIRTKDGVYEVDENSKGNDCFLWVKTNEANIVQCVWLNCIIKQSEKLEELCDRFVIEFLDSEEEKVNQIISPEFQWAKEEFEKFTLYDTTLYGAIRVFDKGLIYVAKMNDKGDFELI